MSRLRIVPGEGTVHAKARKQDLAWCVGKTAMRREKVRAEEGQEQVLPRSVGQSEE